MEVTIEKLKKARWGYLLLGVVLLLFLGLITRGACSGRRWRRSSAGARPRPR